MQLVETTIKGLKAPSSSNNHQVHTAMEMSPTKASNAITSTKTVTNEIYTIKNNRAVFSTQKRQQAPSTRSKKHASTNVTIILEDLTATNQQ